MDAQQNSYFITGTDTDVGKTVASSWLALHLDAAYWKPTQSGIDGDIDETTVRRLTGFDEDRFYPSTYTLTQPLSPHESARRDGVHIEMDQFVMPDTDRPLVIEGAGGLMVPLNETSFVIDLIEQLSVAAILVCRSGLGTINHTLLSIKALQDKNIPIAGLIINGLKTPHNRHALEEYGGVPVLAEIDRLDPLNKEALLSITPEFSLTNKAKAA